MARQIYDTWDELLSDWEANPNITGSGTTGSRGSSSGSGSGVPSPAMSHKELRGIVQELLREIRNACSSPPWHLHSIFYNNPMTITDNPDGSISVSVPFTEKSYRRNLFDDHYSFIPLLMDQGWIVHRETASKYPATAALTYPTFERFVGTKAMQTVIDNFNAKYAPKGISAQLNYDDDSLGFVKGHYMTSL